MTLTIYKDILNDMVRDTDGTITDAEIITALGVGSLKYSKDRPRTVKETVTSDGSRYVDLPASWIKDFSKLIDVRKLDDGGLVNWTKYELYNGVSGDQILVVSPLAAGEDIYIDFTFPHTLDEVSTTIPEIDQIAVCYWAAAHLLDQLAAHYTGHKSSLIQADTVDWHSKSRDYAYRAKAQRGLYFDHMGIKQGKIAAAGTVVDLDLKNSRGRDHLFHKARHR